MRGFGRRLEAAQFIGIGKLIEIFQAEELEEKRGRFVEERAAGLVGAAGDADDFSLEESRHDSVDGDAADRFDFGAADGLAVGDDGESFERGLAEARGLGLLEEAVGPDGELGTRLQHVAAGDALDHKAGAFGFEFRAECFHRGLDFADGGFFAGRGFGGGRESRGAVQGVGDGFGSQGPIRGKEQRFDDARQVHPTIF